MAAPLVILVAQSRRAGVVMERARDGALGIRAPREAGALAKQLRAREVDVLQLFDWYHARLGEPEPCLLCGQPAILRDPVENRPCHKVCCGQIVRASRLPAAEQPASTSVAIAGRAPARPPQPPRPQTSANPQLRSTT
jgi:predicted RNase H-like nuclease